VRPVALEASRLTKVYVRNGTPLEVVNVERLTVREGEFITVIGPSGCGKSTLLHMIGGFIPADGGTVEVYGSRVSGPGPDRGMMFQEFALFPWKTVAGNVAWGLETQGLSREKTDETVRKYLEMMGLWDFRHHFPAELSGGMKQRVALARVLAFDPKVLLMDEPFGALDAQTRETMQDELLGIHARTKKTILLVTHDLDEAVLIADRIVVMREGRVQDVMDVPLSRPRGDLGIVRGLKEFADTRYRVWKALHADGAVLH
jgi:NitT/TauT family transport system ATP-binding protein